MKLTAAQEVTTGRGPIANAQAREGETTVDVSTRSSAHPKPTSQPKTTFQTQPSQQPRHRATAQQPPQLDAPVLHLLFKAADLETTTLSQCPPGTSRKAGVVSGQNCFACLPGTFAELVIQDSCTKCQASRFSKKFQATSRVVCQQCPKGSYWPMTGARAQHVGGSDDCRDGGCACRG